MHSSGTSILAEVLDRFGLFLGVDAEHCENSFFREEVAERVLGAEGRWAELPLPSVEEVLARVPAARAWIESGWLARYRALGYDGSSPWGFKDPRSCVILPLYLAIFPGARVLHIVRSAEDVAASLARKRKRGVGARRDPEHWGRVARAYAERVRECVRTDASPYLEVAYESFCREPARIAPGIFEFVGIRFTPEAERFVVERVDPGRIGSARRASLAERLRALVRGGR
jgi:Sulfotransferase family